MTINAVLTLDITGGAGYVTGDTITLTGGTFTTAAIAIVTAAAGSITSVSFGSRGFGYTVAPTGFTTLTGIGVGGTLNSASVGVISNPFITDLVISGGGGYVVGEILTLTGGTPTTAAIAEVTVIGGGGSVTTVVFITRGAGYNSAPTGFTTAGGGTLATMTYVTVGAIPPGAALQSAAQGPATPTNSAVVALQAHAQGPALPTNVAQSAIVPRVSTGLNPLKFATKITALSIRKVELPVPVITPALIAGMTAVAGTAGAGAITVRVTVGIDYFSPVVLGAWSVFVPALIAGQVVEARSQNAGATIESQVETVIVAPVAGAPPDPPFPPHENWAYGSKPL